jgi:hypothetical protein
MALAALSAAFISYRDDPWADPGIQTHSFTVAQATAHALPAAAAQLARELSVRPFPGYLVEQARLDAVIRLTLADWRAGGKVTAEAYAPYARWPMWNADFLRNRYAFFHGTGLGDAGRARRDLSAFLAGENTPFDRGLDATPEPAVANR